MYEKQITLARHYDVSWQTIHRHVKAMQGLKKHFPEKCFIYSDVDADAFDYYWRHRKELKNQYLRKTVEPFVMK